MMDDFLSELSSHTPQSLRRQVFSGRYNTSVGRGVLWRVYLQFDSLKLSDWKKDLETQRQRYDSFLSEFVNPSNCGGDRKMTFVDPLNNDIDDTDANDSETLEEIRKDVTRTFPEVDFFQQTHVQQSMTRILFVYAKLNPHLKYRQGMHELLGPLIYVLTMDGEVCGATEALSNVCSLQYIEHDSFALFEILMTNAASWYSTDTPSQIVLKSRLIQQKILRQSDPALTAKLEQHSIEPQIWGLRWIRLLFSREFDFPSVLELWDALFAASPKLDLVDYVCAVLLLRIREKIITCTDDTDILTCLFHYPTFAEEKMWSFVSNAVYLRNHVNREGGRYVSDQYSHLWREDNPLSESDTSRNGPSKLEDVFSTLSRNWGVDKIYNEVVRAANDVNTMGLRNTTQTRLNDVIEGYVRQRTDGVSRDLERLSDLFDNTQDVHTQEYRDAVAELRALSKRLAIRDGVEMSDRPDKERHETPTPDPKQVSTTPHDPVVAGSRESHFETSSRSASDTPTRKSLAQSQFSWMLGDESPIGKVELEDTKFGPIPGSSSNKPVTSVSAKKEVKKNVFELEERAVDGPL
ncbi:Conserved hypothetical protein [Yarrowia lipolytica]|nr:Conserved hypothetical protein [Yarrowia lipolytica]